MLYKKWLLNNREIYEQNCKKRNIKSDYDYFFNLNEAYKAATEAYETKRAEQNAIKEYNQKAVELKAEVEQKSAMMNIAEAELQNWLINQPNILLNEVPAGTDETQNVIIYESNKNVAAALNSIPHYELENLFLKESAANISGSRFVVLGPALTKLKRALEIFLTNHAAGNGYVEYSIPYLVNEHCLIGTGQLPKFAEDAFCTTDGKWLISTGEIGLVNLFRNKVFAASELPKLCTTFSPCFRSEAGASGKDTRGLIRLHQFHKVELVTICTPEQTEILHQKQLKTATSALELLELPYRILLLCGGDTGFTAAKQYDVEVWMPGMERYLEIASCSQCGDFQARRAGIKYKTEKQHFVHTLNGSALPIERLIAAIIENHYNNGEILIPKVLRDIIKCERITIEGEIK